MISYSTFKKKGYKVSTCFYFVSERKQKSNEVRPFSHRTILLLLHREEAHDQAITVVRSLPSWLSFFRIIGRNPEDSYVTCTQCQCVFPRSVSIEEKRNHVRNHHGHVVPSFFLPPIAEEVPPRSVVFLPGDTFQEAETKTGGQQRRPWSFTEHRRRNRSSE